MLNQNLCSIKTTDLKFGNELKGYHMFVLRVSLCTEQMFKVFLKEAQYTCR